MSTIIEWIALNKAESAKVIVYTAHTYLCSLSLLGMREHVRLEIRRLSKSLVAVVKRTHIRPVTSVNTDVCTEVKIQGEPLTTAFKCAL